VVEGLKHLFVTQSLDSRIEDALPLLARIQQQGQAMKEANIFEAWAEKLVEGTWATPDTPEKREQLVALLSKEFPVGPDATNSTEQLYDLLGDDELFDQLELLAEKDPDADCRQVVMNRMDMLSDHPDIQAVIDQVQIEPAATMNPAEPTDAGMSGNPDDAQIPANEAVKDPATQTEDPADTDQPDYPEYQNDLESILKIAGVPAETRPAPDYESEVDEGIVGSVLGGAAGALVGGPVGAVRGAMAGNAIGNALDSDDEVDEGAMCNMSEAGESCAVHGMEECWGDESPLKGQYGHSGKLKSVEKDSSFLDRLKELSGMMRN
jgi:hypothetical protein